MSANPPFLSVVIPTYNRCGSLEVTLRGLARQSYPRDRFEVLVVSDGSTDGTAGLLARYERAGEYPLRAIFQENGGPARARNRGVAEARGEVIVFLDDDVEPAPQFLEAHAVHHTAGGAGAASPVVIGPMRRDPALRWSEPCWIAWEHAMLERQYSNWETGEWEAAGPNHFYSGNASVRRRLLVEIGGFDESFQRQEDVELAYRLHYRYQPRFLFDPEAAGVHRPHRTFASWLKVPYAYGALDVLRARRGAVSWIVVREAYRSRNAITRAFSDLALRFPAAAGVLRSSLLLAARAAHRLRQSGAACAVLSAIYNTRYLEGAAAELGGAGELLHVIRDPSPSACPEVEATAQAGALN